MGVSLKFDEFHDDLPAFCSPKCLDGQFPGYLGYLSFLVIFVKRQRLYSDEIAGIVMLRKRFINCFIWPSRLYLML